MNATKFDTAKFKALLNPGVLDDLNHFLERLPQNAGNTVLIAAGIAWASAAALGLFTTIKAQDLNNLRAQLQDVQALKPIVPSLNEVAVDSKVVQEYAKKMQEIYKSLEIKANGNTISITSAQTANFSLFREAVAQIQNGGDRWKVGLVKMCVGRECKQKQLSIALKINTINIDMPSVTPVSYFPKPKQETSP